MGGARTRVVGGRGRGVGTPDECYANMVGHIGGGGDGFFFYGSPSAFGITKGVFTPIGGNQLFNDGSGRWAEFSEMRLVW